MPKETDCFLQYVCMVEESVATGRLLPKTSQTQTQKKRKKHTTISFSSFYVFYIYMHFLFFFMKTKTRSPFCLFSLLYFIYHFTILFKIRPATRIVNACERAIAMKSFTRWLTEDWEGVIKERGWVFVIRFEWP